MGIMEYNKTKGLLGPKGEGRDGRDRVQGIKEDVCWPS